MSPFKFVWLSIAYPDMDVYLRAFETHGKRMSLGTFYGVGQIIERYLAVWVWDILKVYATRTLEAGRGPVRMFRLRNVRSSKHSVSGFSIPDGPGLHRHPWRQSLFRASLPENPVKNRMLRASNIPAQVTSGQAPGLLPAGYRKFSVSKLPANKTCTFFSIKFQDYTILAILVENWCWLKKIT